MEDSKKKSILIGVIVACVVLAFVITYVTRPESSGGIEGIKPGEMMWVKCSNPDCGAEYQMSKKEYYEYVKEHQTGLAAPPLVCKECGEESIYRAIKCPNCEVVFFYRAAGPDDFSDRCPECGYSETEEKRKEAREARRSR